jgi:hypothetical protein
MKLKDAIAQSIKRFPSLYRDLDYDKSRLKVLDHFFLTNGNGMAWWDGFITKNCEMEYRDRGGYYGVAGPKYGEQTFNSRFSPDYFTSNKIYGLYSARMNAFRKRHGIVKPNACSRRALSLYPISEGFGHILSIPDNIQNDWLRGAERICQAGLEYWQKPEYWRSNSYYKSIGKPGYKGRIYTRQNWQKFKNNQITLYVKAMRRTNRLLKIRNMARKSYVLPVWCEQAYTDYWFGTDTERD